MIFRFSLPLAGLVALAAALPAHAQTNALGGASVLSVKPPTESAGPSQLFPPLPSLASLPPSAAEQVEEAAPITSGRHSGKRARRAAWHKAVVEPSIRVVVSDESEAYLAEVDRKLDNALLSATRDPRVSATAVSVASTR
ncbi:hypothetical protein [Trinickia acidisoli]|uniref:hypothetical protein n=1 Tax=Trinickia acidisoli TaxID=2767482 RepID=UPI001A8E40E6|nr:hypothetical protein [Trinickia acidisoli]